MGSNGGGSREKPVHEVCVDGFWMGKYEVTRGQFMRFVKDSGYETTAERAGESYVFNQASGWEWKKMSGYYWLNAGFDQNDAHPVVHVSWNDAKAFADWLSRRVGEKFRLPTEAQWEYACRAGTRTIRYWGDDPDNACRYANVADTTLFPGDAGKWSNRHECSDGYWGTAPVGNYKPNEFGLYDMLGNVWEWCSDWYDEDYYGRSPRDNPENSKAAKYRVLRGGSWNFSPMVVRCAVRNRIVPDNTNPDLGFRLVRSPQDN
jgi:formylglycine-generating enzyme required for sulfatase activity